MPREVLGKTRKELRRGTAVIVQLRRDGKALTAKAVSEIRGHKASRKRFTPHGFTTTFTT
jgi:hypothetical protein